jgi:nucleoside triphosphate diphosphatase
MSQDIPTAVPPLPIPSPALPPIQRLIEVMASLRDPDGGCPWDLEQNFESIAPYTIEEAYEVAEAITQGDFPALKDELGDLLLQVIYHGRMAEEAGHFDFDAIAAAITEKMIRRHPHVFGAVAIDDAAAQTLAWEEQKAEERARKAETDGRTPSALDGVSVAYPALMRAVKLQRRASRVGFDWAETAPVVDKIHEELGEVLAELSDGENVNPDAVEDEMGDLLFACVNLARHLGVDPETALRRTNAKFENRFRAVEQMLEADLGHGPEQASLEQMEERWVRAKVK